MSKPSRPSAPEKATGVERTLFVTNSAHGGRFTFQSERMALLFIDTLQQIVHAGKLTIHDFVVMPNHVHLLMTVPGDVTIEKAMQSIKGGFSFRAGRELDFKGEIWQRGFSDVRVRDRMSFLQHRTYIDENPVRAGLAGSPEEYPFGSAFMKMQKRSGI